MKRAPVLAFALLLSGCVTPGADRLGWSCEGAASEGDISATSLRHLDRNGEFVSGHTEWVLARRTTPVPIEARFRFNAADGLPSLDRSQARFRFEWVGDPGDSRQMSLQSGDKAEYGGWSTGPVHDFEVSGRRLDSLLAGNDSLVIQLRNRQGRLHLHTGILQESFDQGLALARQADGRSLAASADFNRLCEREKRIIPT